jgi:2-methylcitrate dehydratase PrpD
VALLLGPDAPAAALWGSPCREGVFGVGLKPYPSCLLTHGAIDAALHLRHWLAGRPLEQIEQIELRVAPVALSLANKQSLQTELDAKFSITYCLRAAFADGGVTSEHFLLPVVRSVDAKQWQGWLDRVKLVADTDVPRNCAVLAVRMADG